MFELTVKIKESNRKYSKSFPYPKFLIDEFVDSCIKEALEDFKADQAPDSVRITIKSEDL